MFKSKFDCRMEVIHEIFHGLELFSISQKDQEDIIYEYLSEIYGPDAGLPDGFFVVTNEKVGLWWGSLGSHGSTNKLEKIDVHE